MSWTDDRVELLKKLWGEGQSASQIAKELGGVTRNAVIGKVHRLGLSNRATSASKTDSQAKPELRLHYRHFLRCAHESKFVTKNDKLTSLFVNV